MKTITPRPVRSVRRPNRFSLLALPALLSVSSASAAQAAAPAATPAVASVNLVIAATTDVHGRLRGWDYYANGPDATHGLARAATIVDSLRRANPNRVLLVDAGDMLQGNPFTYVAARVRPQPVHPVIATMNAMHYDAAVVGNHEFEYGVPFLDSAAKQAKFALLGANVLNSNGSRHFAASTIVTRAGVRVGIVGATTQGSNVWNADGLRKAGITVSDIVPAVRSAVKRVRAEGADVVLVLLHSGLEGDLSYDTSATHIGAENESARVAHAVSGIDAIIFGHSHRELVDTTINGALLIQPKNWATTVGVATLTLEKRRAKWRVVAHYGTRVPIAGHVESRAILAVSDAADKATRAWVSTPLGTTAETWRSDSSRVKDTPIVDFMLEVMRREAHADLAATASFSLSAHIDSGAITLSEISLLYPYDNTLRAVRINGRQLRSFLEYASQYYRTVNADGSVPPAGVVNLDVCGYNFDIVAGADYTIDLRKPVGSRITSLTVGGKAVTDDDRFTMAINNYRQTGGGGFFMLAGAPVTFSHDLDIRQLLIDEVKRKGTLRESDYFTQNWRIEPASVVGRAYSEMDSAQRVDRPCGATTPAATLPAAKVPAGSISPLPASSSSSAHTAQGTRTLQVLTTSDFHAALQGRRDRGRMRGGAVALEAALVEARSECTGQCTSITIDGGDLFSGTPASDWDSGKPTIAVYNRMGISAGALGNHEFDFGQDTLKMRLAQLNYRVLAANVVGTDGKVPSWLKADTIVSRGGLRVGIVGAASPNTPTLTKKRNLKGLQFLAPAPIVSEHIKALRALGVDAVIVTIHDGVRCTSGMSEGCAGSGIDFINALTEKPDLVIMAHAHTNVILNVNGIPTVQVTNIGRAIGVVDIPLSARANTTVAIRDVFGDSLKADDPITDSIVSNSVNRVRDRLEKPVATIAEVMRHNSPTEQYSLGNIMADVARVMTNSDFGAWNNGGIRADLPAGPINYGGVHELSPFGNVLVKLSIRGKNVAALMESVVAGKAPNTHVAGMIVSYDSTRAPGARVVSVTLPDGKPLQPDRVYTLGVNDFMIDDGGFMKPGLIISTEVLPIVDNDAIAEYLRRLPQPVQPNMEVRIRNVATPRDLQ
jgi:2',3'-cyclic-nucleotide 2'-phosphodiesterase/3'-nucleotidase/5'-nucleotidase